MPSFRKLSPTEIAALEQRPLGARAQVAREYDAYMADFTAGDYGQAQLAAGYSGWLGVASSGVQVGSPMVSGFPSLSPPGMANCGRQNK
jgi:hypothetical protein